jgi:prephenate dehydrogenase
VSGVRHLAVVGLGLIGGSFARALRAAGAVGKISGYDLDPAQVRQALALGVIDVGAEHAAQAAHGADVIVLAVPVLATAQALHAVRAGLREDAVVTDVGSTKRSVLAAVADVFGAIPPRFVAGHPIAGTEKSGVTHAQTGLFRGHRVILTPHAAQETHALELIAELWRQCGARVVTMDATRHDAIFAATSHLPHLLAYSFVDMLTRLPEADAEIFPNAGGGFRDFTRIASSSPRMWHDILCANAQPVLELLRRQIGELTELERMMQAGEWERLYTLFERARAARERHLTQIE